MFRCASFFAGVGGIDIAFEKAGIFKIVYANEIDALLGNASQVSVTIPNKRIIIQEGPKHFDERSLHKVFCSYLRTRNIYAKTIFHEKSTTKGDNAQKWVHPDIVGVQFEEYKNDSTLSLLKATEPKESIHLLYIKI